MVFCYSSPNRLTCSDLLMALKNNVLPILMAKKKNRETTWISRRRQRHLEKHDAGDGTERINNSGGRYRLRVSSEAPPKLEEGERGRKQDVSNGLTEDSQGLQKGGRSGRYLEVLMWMTDVEFGRLRLP